MLSLNHILRAIIILFAFQSSLAAVLDELDYRPLDNMPLLGTLAPDATEKYTRLPDSLKTQVRNDLWNLGMNSAGLAVRFRSDSPRIAAKWHSRNKFNMNHMTPTGIRGLDLYVLTADSVWTTVSSARPAMNSHSSRSLLVTDMEPGVMREYMLYLSLYDGVDSLAVGVDSSAVLLPPVIDLPKKGTPVVMYGTSILQGGCATRPGMAHTNILMRDMQHEVINLGFSGNARLDKEIARMIAASDASVIVLDPLPNCTAALLDENLADFIAIIRESKPHTPIILVESPVFPIARFNREVISTVTDKNQHLFAIYNWMKDEGDNNLYYFPAEKILGDNYEATVDNYHFTDYGFKIFADQLRPIIESFLNN